MALRPELTRVRNVYAAKTAAEGSGATGASLGVRLKPRVSLILFNTAMNSSVTHQLGDAYRNVVSFFSTSGNKSKFDSAGTLTAQEYIEAGDLLVFKFPTWQWQPAKKGLERSHFPADKQYLITRNVPCLSRVKDVDSVQFTDSGEGWAVADSQLDALDATFEATAVADVAVAKKKPQARSYDLTITWDKYYQTPRLWLFGYGPSGTPLTEKEVCEDVLTEYISKTVTVDPHPSTGLRTVSIHPCQHAAVMLKTVNEWKAAGKEVRPDLSIFVFLKFISGVVPTINYDFTMEVEM